MLHACSSYTCLLDVLFYFIRDSGSSSASLTNILIILLYTDVVYHICH